MSESTVSYGLSAEVAKAYTEALKMHIMFVQEAGRELGVPEKQLIEHDASKWREAEFAAYAKHSWARANGLPVEGEIANNFAVAWLHHIHANPHHWQHWIFPDGFAPQGATAVECGVVEMPRHYALEMLADWQGASKAYTGSWDMTDWLWNHLPRITVHSRTAEFLRNQLDHMGYADVVYSRSFAHEL